MREVKYSPLWGCMEWRCGDAWSGGKEEHIQTTRNVAACVKLRAQGTLICQLSITCTYVFTNKAVKDAFACACIQS